MNRLEHLATIPARQGCAPWCARHDDAVCNAADVGSVGLTYCPDEGNRVHVEAWEGLTPDEAERLADAIRAQAAKARAGRAA